MSSSLPHLLPLQGWQPSLLLPSLTYLWLTAAMNVQLPQTTKQMYSFYEYVQAWPGSQWVPWYAHHEQSKCCLVWDHDAQFPRNEDTPMLEPGIREAYLQWYEINPEVHCNDSTILSGKTPTITVVLTLSSIHNIVTRWFCADSP